MFGRFILLGALLRSSYFLGRGAATIDDPDIIGGGGGINSIWQTHCSAQPNKTIFANQFAIWFQELEKLCRIPLLVSFTYRARS